MKYLKSKKPSGRSAIERHTKCRGWCGKKIPYERWTYSRLCAECEVKHKSGKPLPKGRSLF